MALIKEGTGTRDPEAIVRKKAGAIVSWAQSLGWTGPPFDPKVLAGLLGIRVTEGPPTMVQDALIRPLADGRRLEIVWNPRLPATRRNYAIFHEIAHTFFPDCYETVHHRDNAGNFPDPDREVETLCELAAAEMLMPVDAFTQTLETEGLGLAALDPVRKLFAASREAVAIRMVLLGNAPLAAAVLSLRTKPSEASARRRSSQRSVVASPKLRVDMMVCSPTFQRYWLPKHKSIPDKSCAYKVLASNNGSAVIETIERWHDGRMSMPRCFVEAKAIPPAGEVPRVMVMLRPIGG